MAQRERERESERERWRPCNGKKEENRDVKRSGKVRWIRLNKVKLDQINKLKL